MRRSSRFLFNSRGYLGVGLGILLLGGAFGLHTRASAQSRPAARAVQSTIDPRLIVRPHSTAVTATLAGGVRLSGDLSPSLAGVMNTLTLHARAEGGVAARDGSIHITLSMPGMRMFPVRATLAFHAGAYRGSLWVPMFGSYLAHLAVETVNGHFAGTTVITIPIDLGSAAG